MHIKTLVSTLFLMAFISGCSQQPTSQVSTQPVSKSSQTQRTVQHQPSSEADDQSAKVQFTIYPKNHPTAAKQQPLEAVISQSGTAAQNDDLWQRVRSGMALQDYYDNPGIQKQVAWYSKNQTYFDRVIARGQYFLYHIVSELEANDMPLELAMLPVVESAYDPFAYSHSHASGLWQFIPGTGSRFGLKRDWWYDGRRDPVASTEAAIKYLSYLHKYFDGDWLLALAAYNSGEGNVRRAIKRNKKAGKPTDFWSLKLPRETRAYVPQLLAISRIVNNPEQHGISLASVANKPYFSQVQLPEQIDISIASKMAGVEATELYQLNAGYSRRVTHPTTPQHLLLPVNSAKVFEQTLASTPKHQWAPIKQYVVKSGDTLSHIAKTHHVPVKDLRLKNALSSDFLRIGQRLKIPGSGIDGNRAQPIQTYTVKNGDSLWKIAKQKQVSVRNLAKWNNLDIKSPLKLGQRLSIGDSDNSSPASKIKKVRYKVRKGDSLYRIASKFDIKINDILAWNKLNPKKYLKPGQRLTLFVDVLNI